MVEVSNQKKRFYNTQLSSLLVENKHLESLRNSIIGLHTIIEL